ncbi:BBF_collapsed_G0008770.mRNA.1.CDS.1 [Saccharomyces cerevisiae]|nr:BBF_collapsed_G0008770.mRNA.1.CDS.1 [Saccharomyces cerevisiae]
MKALSILCFHNPFKRCLGQKSFFVDDSFFSPTPKCLVLGKLRLSNYTAFHDLIIHDLFIYIFILIFFFLPFCNNFNYWKVFHVAQLRIYHHSRLVMILKVSLECAVS